jgi:hypothetical protein
MWNDTLALNNHLVATLELIGDEELALPETEMEVNRAKAVLMLAEDIAERQVFIAKINRYADPELAKTGPLMEKLELLIADRERELKEAEA